MPSNEKKDISRGYKGNSRKRERASKKARVSQSAECFMTGVDKLPLFLLSVELALARAHGFVGKCSVRGVAQKSPTLHKP